MEKQIPVSSRKIEELWNAIEQFEELLSARSSGGEPRIEALYSRLRSVAWSLQLTPLKELSSQLRALIDDVAGKLGKKVVLEWTAPEIEIGLEARDALSVFLLHAARNAVDHGIESPAERLAAGKKEAGRIRVRAGLKGGTLHLTFQDDGRGADLDRVRARAPDRDPWETLFEPGFTTRSESTEFSGRGIGLDSMRSAIRTAGGDLLAFAVEPSGFGLSLQLPLEVLGAQVASLEIGSHRFWVEAAAFERGDHLHPDEDLADSGRLGQILGAPAPASPVFARVKGEGGRFVATLAVDRIGIPQRRFFRKLDPIWRGSGDPALRAWIDASEGHVLACRSQLSSGEDPDASRLSVLADATMIAELLA